MQSLDSLLDELKVEIFQFVPTPISLSLVNRNWYNISQDPHARAGWLFIKYGKAHSLFHAIRLGKHFLTKEVLQALLARNVILPRYFIQRLFMHYGRYDQLLLQFRVIYNTQH